MVAIHHDYSKPSLSPLYYNTQRLRLLKYCTSSYCMHGMKIVQSLCLPFCLSSITSNLKLKKIIHSQASQYHNSHTFLTSWGGYQSFPQEKHLEQIQNCIQEVLSQENPSLHNCTQSTCWLDQECLTLEQAQTKLAFVYLSYWFWHEYWYIFMAKTSQDNSSEAHEFVSAWFTIWEAYGQDGFSKGYCILLFSLHIAKIEVALVKK